MAKDRREYFKNSTSFIQALEHIGQLNKLSKKLKVSKAFIIREAITQYLDRRNGKMELTWKDFVIMCCKSGVTSSSEQIATLLQDKGHNVTKGQVAAVKANWTMGKYND